MTMVGPILQADAALTPAIVEALREANPNAVITDHGSYLRVSAPEECLLPATLVERRTGSPFRLPGDLEAVMSSFKGKIDIGEREVVWRAPRGKTP